MTLNPTSFSLRESLVQIQEMLRQDVETKGLTFTLNIEGIT
ncbi:MAG: hypothetical protein SPJ89_05225 [Treponema sp.]|nr:hypothetical protein [Spirochaetales bacterium]MDY5811362.1 hypothetical protein [Treponema sp.]